MMLQPHLQVSANTPDDSSGITHVAGTCLSQPSTATLYSWVIDSGATSHICCDRSLFINMKPVEHVSVILPTRSRFAVEFVGTVSLTPEVELNECLYVPSFAYNLLSISSLLRDSNYFVNFYDQSCALQDKSRSKMIGKVELLDGLYILSVPRILQPKNATVLASKATLETWHQRLRHPSTARLHSMKNLLHTDDNSDKHDHCRICPLALQRRLSFPVVNNVAKHVFNLVHCDVWCPFRLRLMLDIHIF